MNVLWVQMDAISIVSTPLEAIFALATLDTKSLPTTEFVWVREYTICGTQIAASISLNT